MTVCWMDYQLLDCPLNAFNSAHTDRDAWGTLMADEMTDYVDCHCSRRVAKSLVQGSRRREGAVIGHLKATCHSMSTGLLMSRMARAIAGMPRCGDKGA